jgi:hypothetical protein
VQLVRWSACGIEEGELGVRVLSNTERAFSNQSGILSIFQPSSKIRNYKIIKYYFLHSKSKYAPILLSFHS